MKKRVTQTKASSKKTTAKKAPSSNRVAAKKVRQANAGKPVSKKRPIPRNKGKARKTTTKKKTVSVNKSKTAASTSAKKKKPTQSVTKNVGKAKKAVKKSAAKKAPAKKAAAKKAPAKKAASKKAPARKQAARKAAPAPKPATSSGKPAAAERPGGSSGDTTSTRVPPKSRPIAFSMEEAQQVARSRSATDAKPAARKAVPAPAKKAPAATEEPKPKARVLGAASLSDILGRNPKTQEDPISAQKKEVPKKLVPYFDLLIELRDHVLSELDLHTKDTLKRSSKEDTGDLSSYSQHMADAGTDSFDRDFALSLVSTEQEALAEIEAAIDRIHKGTYGVCEITGQPIRKERLMAVPFARYSVEGQAEYEKTLKRPSQRGGTYLDSGDDANEFLTDDSDD